LFLLDADVHELLRKVAIDSGVSMAQALREAVQMWLRREEKRRQKGGQMGP